ncbi:MAG: EAL domain-containing protein [Eubacterium sp.]|nr:EAL domain-containing protein [Eubacterium sp.]
MVQLSGVRKDNITHLPILEDFQKHFFITAGRLRYPVVVGINIKNFKYFNQTCGFENGNLLLERMADHFCFTNPDCRLASRIYGDHMIVLAEAYTPDEIVIQEEFLIMCRDFSKIMNREFPQIHIYMNCGACFISKQDRQIDRIIDRVRYAQKENKDDYKSSVTFYTKELEQKILCESRIIPMFEQALEDNRILLYLQPKFSIDEQKLAGAEALARIRDTDGDILTPGYFVPLLEKSGMIMELDRRIIHLLADTMKEWMAQGIDLFAVSVNLSRLDFTKEGFLDEVIAYIDRAGVPRRFIEFELTETVFCENLDVIIRQIERLRTLGFRISMDDFGSGYNSLDVIGMVPADVIKFDRSFVLHSLKSKTGQEVMRSLMEMFQRIDFEVLCEGIETKDEEELVYACGCNQIQGYLHDKPMDAPAFTEKYLRSAQ